MKKLWVCKKCGMTMYRGNKPEKCESWGCRRKLDKKDKPLEVYQC